MADLAVLLNPENKEEFSADPKTMWELIENEVGTPPVAYAWRIRLEPEKTILTMQEFMEKYDPEYLRARRANKPGVIVGYLCKSGDGREMFFHPEDVTIVRESSR